MRKEIATILYEITLARLHAAEAEILKYPASWQAEWRTKMLVQKIMAEAELEALDKILRDYGTTPAISFLPECKYQVQVPHAAGVGMFTGCQNKNNENYLGPCSKHCEGFK